MAGIPKFISSLDITPPETIANRDLLKICNKLFLFLIKLTLPFLYKSVCFKDFSYL